MKNVLIFLLLTMAFSCDDKDSKQLANDYREITDKLSVQDFEKIKTFILDSGKFEPYFNMYQQQPVYSFDNFLVTLLPEVGQHNIACDPEISDFNQLVIYDPDLQSTYLYFLMIRQGDFKKENIEIPDYDGLKENRVYLMRFSDHDLDELFDESEYYIIQMKNKLE